LGGYDSLVTLGEDFNGLMDEVFIYNRALSNSEIQQIMQSALGPECVSDADCITSGAPYCVDEVCVECSASVDCVGNPNGEVCLDNSCVACVDDNDCVGNMVCENNSCYDDITNSTLPIDDLLSYWSFDEGTGSVAHDEVSSYDGALSAGVQWTAGYVGGGLSFDGDDTIVINDPDKSFSDVTISLWAKLLHSVGAEQAIFQTGWNYNTEYFLIKEIGGRPASTIKT